MDKDELVTQCLEAVADRDPRQAVRAVLERAVRDRTLTDSLRTRVAGIDMMYDAENLTVFSVTWPPLMTLYPHDHRIWAAIGIYGGREDNAFYRRQEARIVESGGKTLDEGDVLLLGDDVIHSVANPNRDYAGAIHVYGGDFLGTPRSQWNAKTLLEEPYDFAVVQSEFDRAEREFSS